MVTHDSQGDVLSMTNAAACLCLLVSAASPFPRVLCPGPDSPAGTYVSRASILSGAFLPLPFHYRPVFYAVKNQDCI